MVEIVNKLYGYFNTIGSAGQILTISNLQYMLFKITGGRLRGKNEGRTDAKEKRKGQG